MSMLPMESSRKVSRRQRNARSRPGTKVELQFVNVVPNGQDQKTETQAIIRANAAHFHWRHNRPPRDKCKLKKSRHGAVYDHDGINSCTLLPLKNTQLGFDVVDPFSSYECELPRDFVNRCITFSKQHGSCDSHTANSLKMLESSCPLYSLMPLKISTSEPACYSSQSRTPVCCTCSSWEL
jgi:hypothetical protein